MQILLQYLPLASSHTPLIQFLSEQEFWKILTDKTITRLVSCSNPPHSIHGHNSKLKNVLLAAASSCKGYASKRIFRDDWSSKHSAANMLITNWAWQVMAQLLARAPALLIGLLERMWTALPSMPAVRHDYCLQVREDGCYGVGSAPPNRFL